MAFRFQRRIKIAPGVRLNVSKSGLTTSIGGRGATVNIGSKGVRTTVGIPGTGLSWSRHSGWSNAPHLKPGDELLQLEQLLDKLATKFNAMSPKANKVSANWNKAVESFKGGRGPSAAKYQTLTKRFDTAIAGYRKIENDLADQSAELNAIVGRLSGMSFGIFSGRLKAARHELLGLAHEHKSGAKKLSAALQRLRSEVQAELSSAKHSC